MCSFQIETAITTSSVSVSLGSNLRLQLNIPFCSLPMNTKKRLCVLCRIYRIIRVFEFSFTGYKIFPGCNNTKWSRTSMTKIITFWKSNGFPPPPTCFVNRDWIIMEDIFYRGLIDIRFPFCILNLWGMIKCTLID